MELAAGSVREGKTLRYFATPAARAAIGIEQFPHDVYDIARELFLGESLEDLAVAIRQHAVNDRLFRRKLLHGVLIAGGGEQFGDEAQGKRPRGELHELQLQAAAPRFEVRKDFAAGLPLLPVLAADGLKRLFCFLLRVGGPRQRVRQGGAVFFCPSELALLGVELRLQRRDLRVGRDGRHLLREAGLKDAGVGNEPLGQVEPQQRLDRAAEGNLCRVFVGEETDLLGVEEEELGNAQRDDFLHEVGPVVGGALVLNAVPANTNPLAKRAAPLLPGAMHLVGMSRSWVWNSKNSSSWPQTSESSPQSSRRSRPSSDVPLGNGCPVISS